MVRPFLRTDANRSGSKVVAEGVVSFVGSFLHVRDMPQLPLPEFMLVGRSNVGKSSALNSLCGQKKLAVVSKTPGRTRTINLFRMGNSCTIADVPGYGFTDAKHPSIKEDWRALIGSYVQQREELRLAVLLIDAQRNPMNSDKVLLDFLQAEGMPSLVVATKADKLKESQLAGKLEALQVGLHLPEDQPLPYSSVTRAGRSEVWSAIMQELGSPTRR